MNSPTYLLSHFIGQNRASRIFVGQQSYTLSCHWSSALIKLNQLTKWPLNFRVWYWLIDWCFTAHQHKIGQSVPFCQDEELALVFARVTWNLPIIVARYNWQTKLPNKSCTCVVSFKFTRPHSVRKPITKNNIHCTVQGINWQQLSPCAKCKQSSWHTGVHCCPPNHSWLESNGCPSKVSG